MSGYYTVCGSLGDPPTKHAYRPFDSLVKAKEYETELKEKGYNVSFSQVNIEIEKVTNDTRQNS